MRVAGCAVSVDYSSRRDGVWALVLTYGERYTILRRTLAGLRDAGIERVFVVANDPPYDLQSRLEADSFDRPRHVEVLRAEENLGSAGGYRLGIEAARLRPEVETLWLFDDDNVPAPDSLEPMIRADASMHAGRDAPLYGLLSHRPDKRYLARLVAGEAVSRVYPRPGSFSGFHMANVYRRMMTSASGWGARRAPPPPSRRTTPIQIPWAPWGGLWLPRRTLLEVGLPRAELFLYADDTEYTYRVTVAGGGLYLIPESVVTDVDVVRFGAAETTVFRTFFAEPSDARVYYLLRNQTYFERNFQAPHSSVFYLNRQVFEGRLAMEGLRRRRPERLLLLRRAIRDGLMGHLGRRKALGL